MIDTAYKIPKTNLNTSDLNNLDLPEFAWIKSYPVGISKEVEIKQYSNLVEMFNSACASYINHDAFENFGVNMKYYQLDLLSNHFAAYLQCCCGLQKGDRIALMMPNLLQYPIALIGALKVGLVVVNTNPLYTPREMKHQLNDSGAKAIVICANFAHHLEQVIEDTKVEHVIVTQIGDRLGSIKRIVTNIIIKHVRKMVPQFNLKGAVDFNHVLRLGNTMEFASVEVENTDLAFLQYTGGTTGVAKGAMLTHQNILANIAQISEWMCNGTNGLEKGKEVVITAIPLYHVLALTCNCLAMMSLGAKNVFISNPRDMPGFVKELRKHKFSLISGVNTLFSGLLNQPHFELCDFSNLKVTIAGGMAAQRSVADRWLGVTGRPIVEGYGLTETSPVLTINPIDGSEQLGNIGLPLPNTEIAILDENGFPVPFGTTGEICAKGPQVMKGYWRRDEETKMVFDARGYFHTGDLGLMKSDGFVKIVDRIKEMINVSGFNVYPSEIEEVISSHPKVLEVGVIGVPDEKSHEAVMAYVVKKDNGLSKDELRVFCRLNLTAYKVPKHIEFRNELPKSPVGKILRRLLKE